MQFFKDFHLIRIYVDMGLLACIHVHQWKIEISHPYI